MADSRYTGFCEITDCDVLDLHCIVIELSTNTWKSNRSASLKRRDQPKSKHNKRSCSSSTSSSSSLSSPRRSRKSKNSKHSHIRKEDADLLLLLPNLFKIMVGIEDWYHSSPQVVNVHTSQQTD